jgi:Family of unknown function (DUF5715)
MARFLKICSLAIIGLGIILIVINIIDFQSLDKGYDYFFTNIIKVKCIDYKQEVFSKKLNDKIPDYIESSMLSGIKKCKDEKEILERVGQGKLVEIRNGNGFVIGEMSHSYPYLTNNGHDLLSEISKRFHDKISGTRLKGSRFKITSMTRTTDKLKNLREINSNTSANSPHLYGNAFDIGYLRFSTRKLFLTYCDKKYLKEALAEVIWQLREEKKCWATYETKQSCFHVVAR